MQKISQPNFKSVFIYENDFPDTQICEICCERSGTIENKIVFCELCNLGVHQYCYGYPLSEEVPDGDWWCDRCKFCATNKIDPRNINCYLCNYNIGSLKKVQNNRWAHIICVNWIPEIFFENPINKNKVEFNNNDLLSLERKKGQMCYLCGSKDGYCIPVDYNCYYILSINIIGKKCEKPKCSKFYHVFCAQKFKIIFSERLMSVYLYDKKKRYIMTYCLEHLRTEFLQNKKFSLEYGIQKEKMGSAKSQKEIIKNRTNLEDDVIKADIYQDGNQSEFKFQYNQLKNYLIRQDESDDVQEIPQIIAKKLKFPKVKKKRKPKHESSEDSDDKNNTSENDIEILANPEKKIKSEKANSNFLKKPYEIPIKNHEKFLLNEENSSIISTFSINHDNSEDFGINLTSKGKKMQEESTKNGASLIENNEENSNKISSFIENKENNIKDLQNQDKKVIKLLDKANGESPRFEQTSENLNKEENLSNFFDLESNQKNSLLYSEEDDFISFDKTCKRHEIIDKIKDNEIATVETLNKNSTFSNIYEDLLNKKKIIYLDNPFSPKHTDTILIKERQMNKKPEEIDYNLIYRNLLSFQRKEIEKKEAQIETFHEENTTNNSNNDLEFCTKISKKFEFSNSYEFEEISYLAKSKNEFNK